MKPSTAIFSSSISCILLLSCCLMAAGQSSPGSAAVMYRGDAQHSGTYPDSKSPRGKIKWAFPAGNKIRSTPVLFGESVYFGSDDGYLYALDSASGKLKWKFKAAGAVSSSPAIYQNTIYIEAGNAAFHAVDAVSGREKWNVKSGPALVADPAAPYSPTWEYEHSSPVIAGGMVYFGSADGNLYALDPATGKQKWVFKTAGRIRATPAVAEGVVYLGSMDGTLYALAAQDGALKWKFKTAGNQYFPKGEVQSSPSVSGGMVYFGSRDSALYAVNTADGTLQWKKEMENSSWVISGPAIYKGLVIIGTSDAQDLRAYDAATGDLKWKAASPSPGNILASPTIAGDIVYVGDFYGTMLWFNASTGKLVGGFTTDSRIIGSAVVKDGVLYFGGEDEVFYAIE